MQNSTFLCLQTPLGRFSTASLVPAEMRIQVLRAFSAGTWAGIQAARLLQQASIDCELTDVYSIAQAAAAVQAKVAVLVLNVTHINVWYDRHPGAIRDPQVQFSAVLHVLNHAYFFDTAPGCSDTASIFWYLQIICELCASERPVLCHRRCDMHY